MGVVLLQLVYTSTATSLPSAQDLADLCEQAYANNAPVEITGILASRGGRFLQVLEGPKEAVEDTFLRIVRDPRHHELVLLSRRITTVREFGKWSMACSASLNEDGEIVDRIAKLTEHAPAPIRRAFAEMVEIVSQ